MLVITARSDETDSDVGALIRMPLQIPAGLHARVWKQRIDAALWRRRVEDELGLAVLLQDGVIVSDHDRTVGIAVCPDSKTEEAEVYNECKDNDAGQKCDDTKE